MKNISEFKKKYPNGFYGKDINTPTNTKGIWNSIKWIGNRMYRERAEVLILNDKNEIFLAAPNHHYKYTIPGGSVEPDIGIIDTAIKETQEEALINIKDVMYINSYIDDRQHSWEITLNDDDNIKIKYDGNINYICVARYDSKYKGHINDSDIDDKTAKGKFKSIKSVMNILTNDHKHALKEYLSKSFSDKNSEYISFNPDDFDFNK